jgi:tetraacyldisaccharide 4'-kinase
VVIAIVQHLQSQGLRTGVISRGYGRSSRDCRAATPDSPASEVGDEPALIARSCGVPVFVAPQRLTAARALLAAHPDTDILVCDDGLQHLALARDLEICVFNDDGVGNGFLLPAGPLREPWPRAVDCVLYTDGALPPGTDSTRAYRVERRLARFAVRQDGQKVPLSQLQGQPLHAVAAVARPGSFFAMLRAEALQIAHAEALPDHYDFGSWKRTTDKGYTLVCTEKDAVKLWQHCPDALAVPLQLHVDPAFFQALDARLRALPQAGG